MTWLGKKTLAFIPLSRTNAQPPDVIPQNWAEQITQRVFYDPLASGLDRSLRAYVHTVSYGLADLDVVIQLPETIDGQDIAPDALEAAKGALLRANGFDGAAIVMLGGPYGGETIGYWSRFTMSDDVGHWIGELVHQPNLCNLPDLFDFTNEYPAQNMLGYDQEAGYLATHFCAWTKRAIGWLDPATVQLHLGQTASYTLHAISLPQPPPAGRVAAVQIGQQVPYLMVEARLRADQFDANIPTEGVIVYQVQTSDPLGNAQNSMPPLNLLTPIARTAPDIFTLGNVTVQVTGSVPGGFTITVTDQVNTEVTVPDVTGDLELQATKAITAAGLKPVVHVISQGPKHPATSLYVRSQTPPGGTVVARGSSVNLTVVGGPIP